MAKKEDVKQDKATNGAGHGASTAEPVRAEAVKISPPRITTVPIRIRGTAPYVQHRFSEKAMAKMRARQEAGSQGDKGKKREPRDFQGDYESAQYLAVEGWRGIPATGFRNAMISACRVAGFVMTRAKLSVFVVADGYDSKENKPLVRITKGEPRYHEMVARNDDQSADIRVRPMWDTGWEATVRVSFDEDQFSVTDVVNLMARAGMQVGVGEGRPDSKNSGGLGWGTFEIVD